MTVSEKIEAGATSPSDERTTLSAYLKERPNLIRIVAVIAFFIFWEFAGREGNELFMSYPSAIIVAAWIITADGTLIEAFRASMVPFAIGMAISIVGGIAFGVVMARVWLFEYIIDPYVNALYAIPRIALVPLITLVAGLQTGGKVTIIVSIAIFPIIINTYAGMKDVRGTLLEIGQAFCASERQIFFKIVLPYALPFIMAGIRLAVGASDHWHGCRRIVHGRNRAGRIDRSIRKCFRNRPAVRTDRFGRNHGCADYPIRSVHRIPIIEMARARARTQRAVATSQSRPPTP